MEQLPMEEILGILRDPAISKPVDPSFDLLLVLAVHGEIQVWCEGPGNTVVQVGPDDPDIDLLIEEKRGQWLATPRMAIRDAVHFRSLSVADLRLRVEGVAAVSWRSSKAAEFSDFVAAGRYVPARNCHHYLPRLRVQPEPEGSHAA